MDERIRKFFDKQKVWSEELNALRSIVLESGLEETVKWGMPTCTGFGKNVVGLGAFKGYVGLWFFQGALIDDSEGYLMNAQTGKTKAMRQWRFRSLDEIRKKEILNYIKQAIENAKQGKEIKPERNKSIDIPKELMNAFEQDKTLKESFDGMSKTKRRELAEHVGAAKRQETRDRRLMTVIDLIKEGKGLNDNYRKKK